MQLECDRLIPLNETARIFGESRATFYRKRARRIANGLEESVEDNRRKYTLSSINKLIRKSVES